MDRTHRLAPVGTALLSRLSLRANLAVLIALGAAIFTAERVRGIVQDRAAAIDAATAEIVDLAEEGAHRQAEIVSQAESLLRLAAGLREVSARSVTDCQVPFRRMSASTFWLLDVSLVDRHGNLVCTTAQNRPAQGVGDRQYFRDVFRSRSFVLSDYIVSRLNHRPVLVAAMPQFVHGLIDAVLLASIDVRAFSDFAPDAEAEADVLLLDSAGTIVAASPNLQLQPGESVVDRPAFWRALQGEAGVVESAALDGRLRIVGYAKLPATKATLAVMRDRSAVLRGPNREAGVALAKIAVAGMICLLLIWLGGRKLVLQPLGQLNRSAELVGRGDMAARVDTTDFPPELRLLGENFNAMAERIAAHEAEMQRANEQLQLLATTDALTGLANRRRFDSHVQSEWQRAIRDRTPLSVVFVDVDHFKKYNDRYGHIEGDHCLSQVAGVLAAAARRPGDLAARTGGEEFALVLPGADLDHAVRTAEAVRAGVAALLLEHLDSEASRVTVSIGAAARHPKRGEGVRPVLDAADAALYRAKRSGRDRVVADAPVVSLAS